MQFHRHVFRAGNAQDRQRLALKHQRRIRRVRDDDQLVLLGKLHGAGQERPCRARARRVVRIIQHQRLRALEHVFGNGREIGQEMILFRQWQIMHEAAVPFRVRAEDRVARHRHQHHIAGIDQRRRQNRQRRLAAEAVEHFRLRVQAGHAADLRHPLRRRALELRAPVVRVPAILRLVDFLAQRPHAQRHRHLVRLPDAEVNDLRAGMRGRRRPLGAFDLLKFVNLRALAVIAPADAFGKKILNV